MSAVQANIITVRDHSRSLWSIVAKNPKIYIGGGLLFLIIMAALFAGFLGTVDANKISALHRNQAPSAAYWFGTDSLGRDVYSRVLFGGRVSLTVGFAVAFFACGIGMIVGVIAGFFRSIDGLLMRFMDGLMTIPSILLAIAFVAITRPSLVTVVIAITIVEIPRAARIMRSVVLSLREQTFVEAAVVAGAGRWRILFRHVIPNTLPPLIVQVSYVCAHAMIAEAILSFLGTGVPPSVPSWGGIMAEGRVLWQIKPHLVFIPALALSLTVLSVNTMGDGLRDALDPRRA